MRRIWSSSVAAVCLMASSSLVSAQGIGPVGTEFQVNTYTSAEQDYPRVCKAPDGAFTVVWESDTDSGEDVRGQRYASNGLALGTEFQVNTYTSGEQQYPALCCQADGGFVVVWHSDADQDGSDDGIFGQRFASGGVFVGSEFQVNTYTSNDQEYPTVCCDGSGNFVVAWENTEPIDGDSDGVFAQRFANDGSLLGSEFQVNTYTGGAQDYAQICCAASGDFVVTWESYGLDGFYSGIFAQRFASSGAASGSEFQVNTYTFGVQEAPAICCDATGNFVIVWESYGQDEGADGVFAQRFAASGAERGTEFQVNVTTSSDQDDPSICCGPNGDFIVAWSGAREDGSGYGVFTRRFSSSGAAASNEFQVNTYTSGNQDYPSVACDPEGNFVIVWQGGAGQDGLSQGIFGQRLREFVLDVAPTPALSFVGLAGALAALLGSAWVALRRRR